MIFKKDADKYSSRFKNFMEYPKNETEILYVRESSDPSVVYFLGK
jgi:hypothetical protein